MFNLITRVYSHAESCFRQSVAYRSVHKLVWSSEPPRRKTLPSSWLRSTCLSPHQLASKRLTSHLVATRDGANPDDSDEEALGFGAYSVILPPEPFVFGVRHIKARSVPSHISLPPYVASLPPSERSAGENHRPFNGDPYTGDGRIELGSQAEVRLRAAAKLAKETLDFAGSLVDVCFTTSIHGLIVHSAKTLYLGRRCDRNHRQSCPRLHCVT